MNMSITATPSELEQEPKIWSQSSGYGFVSKSKLYLSYYFRVLVQKGSKFIPELNIQFRYLQQNFWLSDI